MRAWLPIVLVLCLGACAGEPGSGLDSDSAGPLRFRPLHIELQVGPRPIAAYQVELVVVRGDATIVGVEGGDPTGFDTPPYYDPAALVSEHIILAAFSQTNPLPPGRHRVATVHLRERGAPPHYDLRLMTAGHPDGSPVTTEEGLQVLLVPAAENGENR